MCSLIRPYPANQDPYIFFGYSGVNDPKYKADLNELCKCTDDNVRINGRCVKRSSNVSLASSKKSSKLSSSSDASSDSTFDYVLKNVSDNSINKEQSKINKKISTLENKLYSLEKEIHNASNFKNNSLVKKLKVNKGNITQKISKVHKNDINLLQR